MVYTVERVINYRANPIEKYDEDFIEKLKLKIPEIIYIYSQNCAINFLKIIKNYQLETLWMNTNLMCIGEKSSSILNEIKWKKIFLFNPGEEEFLLYKIKLWTYLIILVTCLSLFGLMGIRGVDIFQILIGIGIFFIFLVFRGIISKVIIKRLEAIAKRTTNKLDDTFVHAMVGPARFLPIVLGFFIASYYMSFGEDARAVVDTI